MASEESTLTVMTQNLYFGAELTPVFAAANAPEMISNVATAWTQAQATRIDERAAKIAQQIAASEPDLVGLQEVAQWWTGAPGAMTLKYDFLKTILETLLKEGAFYVPVAVKNDLDQAAPLDTAGNLVRLVDRHAVLLRIKPNPGQARPYSVQTQTYLTQFPVPSALLGALKVPRSWIAVDAAINGRPFRFVETHLESLDAKIQMAQAAELLSGPASTDIPVIMAGDFNSNANYKAGDPPDELDTPTYAKLIANGWQDAWATANGGETGNTGSRQPDLRNTPSVLSKRIDLVLTRGGIAATGARLVGNKPGDRTSSGLWPSDHAGLVAALTIPA